MASKKSPVRPRRFLPDRIRPGVRVCVNADVRVPKGTRGVVEQFDERFWNGYTVPVLCVDNRSRHFTPSELDVLEEGEE